MEPRDFKSGYSEILLRFLKKASEKELLAAHDLGRSLVEQGVPVEDIGTLHEDALGVVAATTGGAEIPDNEEWASPVLLEVLMAYGLAFREKVASLERSREALVESEQRLKDFAGCASDWLWETGPDLRYTYVSDSVTHNTGAAPADMVGKKRWEFGSHKSDSELWRQHLEDLEAHRPFRDFVYESPGPDGRERVFREAGIPVFGAGGAFLGYRGTSSDITTQVTAEKKATMRKARLNQSLESISEGFALFDTQNQLVICNNPYRAAYPNLSNILVPGVSFREILQSAAEKGSCADTEEGIAEWVETRLRRELQTEGEDHLLSDGQWYRISERHTRDGGVVKVLTDISDRKTVEDALREQSIRTQRILDNVVNGIVTIDERGIIESINPAAEVMFGFAADDLTGRNVNVLMAEPDASQHDGYIQDYIRTGKAKIIGGGAREVTARRKNGKEFPAELGISEMKLNGRHLFVGVLVDLTNRKRAEAALHERTMAVQLLNSVAIAAREAPNVAQALQAALNAVCTIMKWPVGHALILDKAGDALTSGKLWHLDNPKQFTTFRRASEKIRFAPGVGLPGRVLASGHPEWVVSLTRNPDWPSARLLDSFGIKAGFAFPILVDKKVMAVLEFFSEEAMELDQNLMELMANVGIQLGRAMERREAKKALEASEGRLRSIIDNSPLAIFMKATDGRYLLGNRTFEEWYGLPAVGASEAAIHDNLPKEQGDFFISMDREVLETGQPVKREREVLFPDGTRRQIVSSKYPINDPKSRTIGVGTIQTDVTEQRKTETQLQQAQKMEAVGQLTGGIAHDFNNILAVVLGNLQLIQRRVKDDPKIQKLASSGVEAVLRGADLTKQLLAFSRRQELAPEVLDANDLVAGMGSMLRRTLSETVDIKTVLGDDLGRVMADSAQLESAILNLAINGRDAMPRGGVLMIETSNVDLDEGHVEKHPDAKAGPHVCISVTDTGTGIPADVIDSVFEPFFTTKEVGKGTGLGLSMVYGFVRQSNGHITVFSEENQGTCFRIYLPRTDEGVTVSRADENQAGELPTGTETIFVVEDEDRVRETAALLLEDMGYTVVAESNGLRALKTLETFDQIDLLFTDMIMPGGMNGHELAERVVTLRPGIKVLLTSGYPRDAFQEGRKFPLLSKPYTNNDLARAIRNVLDRDQPQSKET